jgi:hypothetical protein
MKWKNAISVIVYGVFIDSATIKRKIELQSKTTVFDSHHSMLCCNTYFIWIFFCLAHFQKKMETPLSLTAPSHMVKRQTRIISVLFIS